jgi:hypothetical protein
MKSGTITITSTGVTATSTHIDRNVNIDRNNINVGKWEHNSYHRRGVKYDNNAIRNQFAKAGTLPSDRKLDYKGTGRRSGAEARRGRSQAGDGRPDLGGKPDLGKPGKPDLGGKADLGKPGKPDRGGAKPKDRPGGGNAFDLNDGPKAKDFSKRGQASLGNRGANDFARPKGPSIKRGGGGPWFSGGGGGRRVGGGGGGGFRGGGGRGGGTRWRRTAFRH